jgi:hypothetical protein
MYRLNFWQRFSRNGPAKLAAQKLEKRATNTTQFLNGAFRG